MQQTIYINVESGQIGTVQPVVDSTISAEIPESTDLQTLLSIVRQVLDTAVAMRTMGTTPSLCYKLTFGDNE